MMILENKKVAIIGAGPVGLTIARLLQQKGIAVSVYERDKDPYARIWGGTLDLHENSGQAAMKKAGLLDSYFATAEPMGRRITDSSGKLLFSVAPQGETPEINRNNLRKILLDSLKNNTVIWDSKFSGPEECDGKWLLRFDNKTDAMADIVIGANGGMSNARSYITDTIVQYTGTYIIQGEVIQPEIHCNEFYQLCNNSILMTAAGGVNLVANPNNNGTLTYNVTFRQPEQNSLNFQDTDAVKRFLSTKLADWDAAYQELLRATSFFVGLPARRLSLDMAWKSKRPFPVTLIGDAAHLMPPFAGQGVNTGLMDALILSENLTSGKFQTIEAAIGDYEARMFVYAGAAQVETAKNEIAMHEPGFSFSKRFSE